MLKLFLRSIMSWYWFEFASLYDHHLDIATLVYFSHRNGMNYSKYKVTWNMKVQYKLNFEKYMVIMTMEV